MHVLDSLKRFTLFEGIIALIFVLQVFHLAILCVDGHFPFPLLYGPLYWAAYQYYQGVSRRRIARDLICCASPFLFFCLWFFATGATATYLYYTYYLPLALLEQLIYPILILYGLARTKRQSIAADLLKQLMAFGLGTVFVVLGCFSERYWEISSSFDFDSTYTVSITMGMSLFMLGNYLYQYCIRLHKESDLDRANEEEEIGRLLRTAMEEAHMYRDPKLTLQDLADHTGLTKKAISTYLHEVNGSPYYEWLAGYRITYALRLLDAEYDYTLESIAQQCGYSSKTTFVRYFKQRVGLLPSIYRSRLFAR